MVNQEELEWEEWVRLPAAGFEFEDLGDISGVNSPHQKKRRTREEGIGGGLQFKDWGPYKMLILAVMRKVAEINFNLQIIFEAISTQSIRAHRRLQLPHAYSWPCQGMWVMQPLPIL